MRVDGYRVFFPTGLDGPDMQVCDKESGAGT